MKFSPETKEFVADAMRKRIAEKKAGIKQQKLEVKKMEDELKSFEREAADESMSLEADVLAQAMNIVVTANRKAASKKKTFKTLVLECLGHGNPLTSRQLMQCVNSKFARNYEMNTFSGALSALVTSKDVVKYEIPENPLSHRFYYCLPEWFEGDALKKEFVDIISESVLS